MHFTTEITEGTKERQRFLTSFSSFVLFVSSVVNLFIFAAVRLGNLFDIKGQTLKHGGTDLHKVKDTPIHSQKFMKKFALALLSALVLASPAFAIVGGPWDGNIPGNPNKVDPSNIAGTWQGVISGTNITGIMMFGTASSSTISNVSTTSSTWDWWSGTWISSSSATTATGLGTSDSEGRCLVFADGYAVLGQMSAVADLQQSSLSGVIQGSTVKQVSEFSQSLTTQLSATTALLQNNTYQYNNVLNIAGTFSAEIQRGAYFKGTGAVQIQQSSDAVPLPVYTYAVSGPTTITTTTFPITMLPVENVTITVTGVKTSTKTPTFGAGVLVTTPSVKVISTNQQTVNSN